jgi:hypothetical protein
MRNSNSFFTDLNMAFNSDVFRQEEVKTMGKKIGKVLLVLN